METAKCSGCGVTIFAKSGACPRCGAVRRSTRRIAVGLAIFAIGALMIYLGWSDILQVEEYM